jgi:hypothetical protein
MAEVMVGDLMRNHEGRRFVVRTALKHPAPEIDVIARKREGDDRIDPQHVDFQPHPERAIGLEALRHSRDPLWRPALGFDDAALMKLGADPRSKLHTAL